MKLYAALVLVVMGCTDDSTIGGEGIKNDRLMNPTGEVPNPLNVPFPPDKIESAGFPFSSHIFDALPEGSTTGCHGNQCVQGSVEQFGDIAEVTWWLDGVMLCKAVVEADTVIYNDCN